MTNTAVRRRPLIRRSTIALSILAIVAVPALSGCFSGRAATTSMQATMNTGDGTQTQIGNMKILNTTLVVGDPGYDAMLIGTFVNVGIEPDTLLRVEVDGKPVSPIPPIEEMTAGTSVPFGYVDAPNKIPVGGLTGPLSTYVPVTFQFQNAGNVTIQVLTVPAVGQYAGIVPIAGTPESTPIPASSRLKYPIDGPATPDY